MFSIPSFSAIEDLSKFYDSVNSLQQQAVEEIEQLLKQPLIDIPKPLESYESLQQQAEEIEQLLKQPLIDIPKPLESYKSLQQQAEEIEQLLKQPLIDIPKPLESYEPLQQQAEEIEQLLKQPLIDIPKPLESYESFQQQAVEEIGQLLKPTKRLELFQNQIKFRSLQDFSEFKVFRKTQDQIKNAAECLEFRVQIGSSIQWRQNLGGLPGSFWIEQKYWEISGHTKSLPSFEKRILSCFKKELSKLLLKKPFERAVDHLLQENRFTTVEKTLLDIPNFLTDKSITDFGGWIRRVALVLMEVCTSGSLDKDYFNLLLQKVRAFRASVAKILRSHRYVLQRSLNDLAKIFGVLRSYWMPDKLTKPIAFIVGNTDWKIRCSLLSTPLVPSLCMGSKELL